MLAGLLVNKAALSGWQDLDLQLAGRGSVIKLLKRVAGRLNLPELVSFPANELLPVASPLCRSFGKRQGQARAPSRSIALDS